MGAMILDEVISKRNHINAQLLEIVDAATNFGSQSVTCRNQVILLRLKI